jgi:hypothetical protein
MVLALIQGDLGNPQPKRVLCSFLPKFIIVSGGEEDPSIFLTHAQATFPAKSVLFL